MKNSISAITVDGKPLAEYIAKTQPKRIHNKTFTNGISGGKSARGAVIYDAGQKAQKVRVRGEIFSWKEKAPYVASGFSILGGVELSVDEKEVRCHECGEWRECLTAHIRIHRMRAREYRIRHGINMASSLNAPSYMASRPKFPSHRRWVKGQRPPQLSTESALLRAQVLSERKLVIGRARAESQNLYSLCEEQRLKTIRSYAKQLGHTPSVKELNAFVHDNGTRPISQGALTQFFGYPLKSIMLRAGLTPRKYGINQYS